MLLIELWLASLNLNTTLYKSRKMVLDRISTESTESTDSTESHNVYEVVNEEKRKKSNRVDIHRRELKSQPNTN